jgi:hypothetical protein
MVSVNIVIILCPFSTFTDKPHEDIAMGSDVAVQQESAKAQFSGSTESLD